MEIITDMGKTTLIWRKGKPGQERVGMRAFKKWTKKNGGIAPPFPVLQLFNSHHRATWRGILDASILCEIQQAYFIQSDDKEHLHLVYWTHY